MNNDRDLTRGNPLSLIFSFAVSMMLGNIFQQLYTTVDGIHVIKELLVIGLPMALQSVITAIGGLIVIR